MIAIRSARPPDAAAIAAVHVAAWRSAYPGILPPDFLARLSVPRQATFYDSAIRGSEGVHVATVSGLDLGPGGGAERVVGFATSGLVRGRDRPADSEIGTRYVLDDWRERGLGRQLMRAAAAHLAALGCRSTYLWVLRDNPSRWFYERLGGRAAIHSTVRVGG